MARQNWSKVNVKVVVFISYLRKEKTRLKFILPITTTSNLVEKIPQNGICVHIMNIFRDFVLAMEHTTTRMENHLLEPT